MSFDVTNLGQDSPESSASFKFPKKATAPTAPTPPKIQLTSLDNAIPELSSAPHNHLTKPSNTNPKAAQERDPKFVYADLPSGFFFYDFKQLAVSNVKGSTQAKFARAASEKRTRHVVDAISSLLPGDLTAWTLTIPDFYWLMYWIRLNFYTKPTLIHTAICTSHSHLEKIRDKKLPKETLSSVHTITNTSLKESTLDKAKIDRLENFLVTADLKFLEDSPFDLCPATIRDIVDVEENFSEHEDYSEIEHLIDFSSFIQYKDPEMGYASQEVRLKYVADLDVAHLDTIKEFASLVSDYGVDESIKVRCPECSADIVTRVSISAHSFL